MANKKSSNPILDAIVSTNSTHNSNVSTTNPLGVLQRSKSKSKSKSTKTSSTDSTVTSTPITADSFGDLSSYASSSSGGYGGSPIDLTDILNTYSNSAEAQKQTIRDTTAASIKALQDSEASQRASLTKALERFQEDTDKQRQQQQSSFNSSRADLEAQSYLANRQALQSAAARGLGGSGLQQLAQLQNLISTGNETSELAQSNTDTLNSLAQALSRQEEDTKTQLSELASNLATKIQDLNTSQANQLNEIDTNTASLMSQLQYQEAVRAQELAASASAANASSASTYAEAVREQQLEAQAAKADLETLVANEVENIKSSKKSTAKSTLKTAKENVNNMLANYRLPTSQYGASYLSQLESAYNKYFS
jgi:hypothetical protein